MNIYIFVCIIFLSEQGTLKAFSDRSTFKGIHFSLFLPTKKINLGGRGRGEDVGDGRAQSWRGTFLSI